MKQQIIQALRELEKAKGAGKCKPPIEEIKKFPLDKMKKVFIKNVSRAIDSGVPDEEFSDLVFRTYIVLRLRR